MGALEAIALIGTSYVLLSLYRVFSWAEQRYQAAWHRPGQNGYSRGKKSNGKREQFAAGMKRCVEKMRYIRT